VLLIFKEPQTASGGGSYKELFFIQKRDPAAEQWTGRRLGVEKVKSELGFGQVFNGGEFKNYPVDLSSFSHILFAGLPADITDDASDSADLYDLMQAFKKKANLPEDYDAEVAGLVSQIAERATMDNLPRIKNYLNKRKENSGKIRQERVDSRVYERERFRGIGGFQTETIGSKWGTAEYTKAVYSLREIKTPEEMDLMRKTVSISSIAHAETMRAIQPGMSEGELQGIQEYVHKNLERNMLVYPSIVGAGANGCILHYEENAKTHVGKDLVLMDVGAEYHGYSADVTRTFPSTGKFTPDQKVIYDLVYKAQEEVFLLCHEGTPFSSLNKKRRKCWRTDCSASASSGTERCCSLLSSWLLAFPGLDVHDAGNYDQALKENMVITVEPGIYIPSGSPCDKKWWDIGVRIEDDVRIGKGDYELLSHLAPRKSEDVEKKNR